MSPAFDPRASYAARGPHAAGGNRGLSLLLGSGQEKGENRSGWDRSGRVLCFIGRLFGRGLEDLMLLEWQGRRWRLGSRRSRVRRRIGVGRGRGLRVGMGLGGRGIRVEWEGVAVGTWAEG